MKRLFPYPTISEPLVMVAETQAVDGVAPAVDLLGARRSINLSLLPQQWRRASFHLRLDLPQTLLDPTATNVRVTLSINCPSTNLRFAVPMLPAARLGTYVGELEIENGALAHRASLHAIVAATVGGVEDRYLGQSELWNVWVSPPEVPLLTGDLDVKWADFTTADCPAGIDPEFRHQAYYVDITSDPPVIWLNEGVPDLRRLFDDNARRSSAEKALREAHFHSIAFAGWLAMFNASLGAIEYDDAGGVSWPVVEWQRQVLLTLLPKVYPDLTPDDALNRAYEDDLDNAGSRLLQSRAMAAVNGLLNGTQKIRRSIRAMED